MITISKTLENPYYFFADKVLFKIGDEQDEDKCGKYLVTYESVKDKDNNVVKRTVKKGDYYLDEKHNTIQNNGNNTIEVTLYGTELNHTECAKVFPHFDVNYTYNDGTEEDPVTKQYTVHYYMQGMIAVGDKWDETNKKFIRNNLHYNTGDTTYMNEFSESIKKEIEKYIKDGKSIEQIKKIMPHWCFAANKNKVFDVNGKEMTFVDTSSDFTPLTDANLQTKFYEVINKMVKDYANSLLETEGKELTQDAISISNENTHDIEVTL